MKTLEFKTEKGKFLLVELPEGFEKKKNDDEREWLIYLLQKHHNLPMRAERVGFIKDLTEDQASEIVDRSDRFPSEYLFIDYTSDSTRWAYLLNTALESFHSLLQSKRLYFENPLGEEPNSKEEKYTDTKWEGLTEEFQKDYYNWKAVQSELWDKSSTYLFKLIEE